MAEEPGFFSYENFPYPMLALGQTIPRGYQYQSQMTPYKRDARGDWGRALNESIDQFFGMWPQYMQQRRQFTLQRDQLARQRLADKHQAKLRPLELKKLQAEQQIRDNRMQVLKNYPTMVANLPVSDKQKAFLKTLPPTEGLKMMQAIMTQRLKPRTQFIKAGQPDSRGVVRRLDVQEKSDGTIIKAAVSPQKITVPPGGLFPGTKDKNTTGVHVEYDPSSGSLSYPLDKPHTEVITLAVGDVGNPYNVPLAFNPKTKEYSFPLERPHIELKTVQPGEEFPDGTTNNTPRPIQYDKKTNKRFTYEGTAAQKKIVSLGKFDKRRDNFPEHQQNFLKLDMTQGGDGVVILDPAASSMAEEMVTVPPGGLYPDGVTVNNLKTPVQVSRSGKLSAPLGLTIPEEFVPVPPNDPRLDAYPQPLHQYLHINKKNNNISFHPSFTREMQQLVLKEARPSATQRFQKWLKVPGNQVRSYADLEPWTGTSQESKYWFATQNLPADNPLHIDAQNQLNLKHVKVTPNAIIIGRGYKDPSKPDAAKRLPEPTTEKILLGDSVSSLAKRFGTTESQIIAANPDWFNKDMNGKADLKSMRTSEQMEDAEMIIPTGKSQLSPGQIREAHSSRRRARVTEMPHRKYCRSPPRRRS